MKNRIKSWLPTPDSLRSNRWLRWMGPVLADPRLWHFSRKGIALGVALGIFFGLLIPVAQMPASALFAVILRANLPMAVASTLVSNPVTFGPVYYGAYRLGQAVLGEPTISDEDALKSLADDPADEVGCHGRGPFPACPPQRPIVSPPLRHADRPPSGAPSDPHASPPSALDGLTFDGMSVMSGG